MNKAGVYFLANDNVYQWAIAFLNSFRRFNPALQLFLIPFDENCNKIKKLNHKYDFKIYEDSSSFSKLEKIGKDLELGHTSTSHFWFRRFASFWGPLEEFMYLDVRQIILADLLPFLQTPGNYGFDLMHYDCAIDQVYEPANVRLKFLMENKGRGFLSGIWASVKGMFTMSEFEMFATQAIGLREQLNPRNTDQAFLNFCCDMKPVKYGHFAEVIGGYCHDGWARKKGKIYKNKGEYFLWDFGGLDHKKKLILLHWAGYKWTDALPHSHLLNGYSPPTLMVLLKRLFSFFLVRFKSSYLIRKTMGHV